MVITAIRLRPVAHELDPPFEPAWNPAPRRRFEETIVLVETDEGRTGIGSGDTMDGFEAYEHFFVDRDPLDVELVLDADGCLAVPAAPGLGIDLA
jgi:D-galactarolactone cycloisomerase